MDTRFLTPGVMTGVGRHADAVGRLPGSFSGIAEVLHGLLIHEFLGEMYGVALTADDRETVHLRRTADLLDAVVARDDGPLGVAREPARRVATNCRGFTVVAVALLRAHGIPARARCGFGAYFTPGFYEDHWVVEYQDDGRWKRGDAQIDDVQHKAFGIDFDLADLPEGRFLTGGEAWRLVRSGKADPDKFGLSSIPESGDWWIAANLVRDVAALAGVEVLPWDCWPPMPEPGDPVDVELFDRMAAGREPVTVPEQVYNVLRKRTEPLLT
jgi:hypothetical protein